MFATSGVVNTSDARLKKDVVDSTLGLAFVESLRPVQYKWIEERATVKPIQVGTKTVPESVDINGVVTPEHEDPVYGNEVTPIPGVRPHWGLIAQEVQGALTAAGFTDTGIMVKDNPDMLGLNYSEFIAPLVKAVQELAERVRVLEAKP